ncbi:uncharacterized protein LOC111099497 [Crassostrea virginica]
MKCLGFGNFYCYFLVILVSSFSPLVTVAGISNGHLNLALTQLSGMALTPLHGPTLKRSRWIRSPSSSFLFSLRGVCDFDGNGFLDYYERRCLRRFSSLAFGR